MKLVYFSSVSNNTHRFVEKLHIPAVRVPIFPAKAKMPILKNDFVLMTPTYGAGQHKNVVPKQVIKFLNIVENRNHIKGVIGSGNINFGEDYCLAAKIISYKCKVPILFTYELTGTKNDVERIERGLKKFWKKQEK